MKINFTDLRTFFDKIVVNFLTQSSSEWKYLAGEKKRTIGSGNDHVKHYQISNQKVIFERKCQFQYDCVYYIEMPKTKLND